MPRILPPRAARTALRAVLRPGLYDSLTRDHRLLTLSSPLAGLCVQRRGLRLRGRRDLVGVDRLDAVIVINLADRPERLRGFEEEMARLGIPNYTRFEAIRDVPGILGCTRSHAECLRQMVESGWTCALFCEDDARFHVSRRELDVLVEAFLADPRAEVACLAYNHCEAPSWYNPLFVRAPRDTRSASCYLVKASIAPDLAALFTEGAEQLASGGDRSAFGIDRIWGRLIASRVFLLPIRRAAFQEPGYSDVESKFVSYGV